MDHKWLGLYMVAQDLSKGFYVLASIEGNTIITPRINGAHLKVYFPPDNTSSQSEEEYLSSPEFESEVSPQSEEEPSYQDSIPPLPPPLNPLYTTFHSHPPSSQATTTAAVHSPRLQPPASHPSSTSTATFTHQVVLYELSLHYNDHLSNDAVLCCLRTPPTTYAGRTHSSTPVYCGGYIPEFLTDVDTPPSAIPHSATTQSIATSPCSPATSQLSATSSRLPAKRKLTLAATKDKKRRKLALEQLRGNKLEDYIHLTAQDDACSSRPVQYWIEHLSLHPDDKQCLSIGQWFNDGVITAC